MKHDDVMIIEEVSLEGNYFTNIGKCYSAEMLELENYQPEETTRPSLSMYTDKELIDELSRRWEDKQ